MKIYPKSVTSMADDADAQSGITERKRRGEDS
jgi:hypothetical protein